MAYEDYQDPQASPLAKLYPGGSATFQERPTGRVGGGLLGLGGGGGSGIPPTGPLGPGEESIGAGSPPQAAPNADGTLPTNTRQQSLQQVQQAYSTPSRMPGDMGFLNSLLSQSSQAPSASDPIMAGAFGAGRVADQRNIDRQRAALAEQLGSQGLGQSGAMDTRTGAIQQRVGEQQALRESGMLYDESNARRNALLQALGLDQSRYQGDNDMGYRLAALQANLNQNAVQPFFNY